MQILINNLADTTRFGFINVSYISEMLNFVYILNDLVDFRMNYCVAQCEQHFNVFTLYNSEASENEIL